MRMYEILSKRRLSDTITWLVIYAPENGEIPENFIIRLREARIEPIVVQITIFEANSIV